MNAKARILNRGGEHGDEEFYRKISKALGVSVERVVLIEQGALLKLIHPRNREKWRNIIATIHELKRLRDEREAREFVIKDTTNGNS